MHRRRFLQLVVALATTAGMPLRLRAQRTETLRVYVVRQGSAAEARALAPTFKGLSLDSAYAAPEAVSVARLITGRAPRAVPGLRARGAGTGNAGNESVEAFQARVAEAIAELQRQRRGGAVLLVASAETNQQALRALAGLTVEQAAAVAQDPGEVYVVDVEAGQTPRLWKVIRDTNLGDL